MVHFVRDFILNGSDKEIFPIIQNRLPAYMRQNGGYVIQSEINDGDRLYRKAVIHKDADRMIPAMIREQIPPSLIGTVTNLVEEQIFDERLMKIQWSIEPLSKSIYTLSGNIRFISLDGGLCKVVILIYMDWIDPESMIPDAMARELLLPFLEKKIPDMCLKEIRESYNDIMKNEKMA